MSKKLTTLCNTKVNYRFLKIPQLNRVLNQLNPVLTFPTFFETFYVYHSFVTKVFPSGLFPCGFSDKTMYVFLSCSICAACPTYLIVDLIIINISDEYKP